MGSGVALVYSTEMDEYDLGPSHPLKAARVTNSVGLMRAYGLLGEGGADILAPEHATDEDLTRVHDAEYVAAVREASADPEGFRPRMGLGTADNPLAPCLHDISALICGGAILGLSEVLEGGHRRTLNVAGGLHHARRARAAGFCVYNDPAVAIAAALERRPTLRLMYLDIDAHHGDGVQEAFYEDSRVLTVSLHESGRFRFPGTGDADEIGAGDGLGYSANVPFPPLATDDCFMLAFDELVTPLAESFDPDAIVLQAGADANHVDPLTMLGMTLRGYLRLTSAVCDLAVELCEGRVAASGGGGYAFHTVVPRSWTILLANLLGRELPEEIPEDWRPDSTGAPDLRRPETLTQGDAFRLSTLDATKLYEASRSIVNHSRRALAPYHDLG